MPAWPAPERTAGTDGAAKCRVGWAREGEHRESLTKVEDLLARLESVRRLLDETDDPDRAIDILQELAELAKEAEAELQRAKRAAETEAAAPPDVAEA